MSYKVKKLVVGKGKTTSHEQTGEWIRQYYEVEIDIPDESELSVARECAEGLLNEWLETVQETPQQKWNWNPEKIVWNEAEGSHGKYERSEDVNSIDFKNLVKDLAEHQGKLSRNGFFYWSFSSSAIVGRKKRQGKS